MPLRCLSQIVAPNASVSPLSRRRPLGAQMSTAQSADVYTESHFGCQTTAAGAAGTAGAACSCSYGFPANEKRQQKCIAFLFLFNFYLSFLFKCKCLACEVHSCLGHV